MKAFADLYTALDETNKTSGKVSALVKFFREASAADAAWAIYFLMGKKPRQVVPTRRLAEWAAEGAKVPNWLFAESYDAVGDLAETIALLLPPEGEGDDVGLADWVEERLLPLRSLPEAQQRESLLAAWKGLSARERLVWNKLITGAFRVGVSRQLVTRALAEVTGIEPQVVAHRLMGNWEPTPEFYGRLTSQETTDTLISQPYPFFLAFPLADGPEELGEIEEWQAEWKWDGIRSQIIRRGGSTFIWTRGEELVTDRYPEIALAAERLPDGTVIDGEILPWKDGKVMPFGQLQRRIGRKNLTQKLLAEIPAVVMAYDLLEHEGSDIRELPLGQRRELLEKLLREAGVDPTVMPSPLVEANSWEELSRKRALSREQNVEGLMLKRCSSPYRVGRQRGDWWKWKIAPLSVDCVLIYAQRGSGKRASLYTDYTFGVWDGDVLVPFAKAYSGLTDEEIRQVDAFVRRNTLERFGPVRVVKAELVFELAFEGIQKSTRHKSGIAVRFPRMLRWRKDKKPEDADTLETVRALLPSGQE